MTKNRLKEIRTKKGMTLVQFSTVLGIKGAWGEYSSLEKGIRIPRVDKAINIARKLKVRVEDIWSI